MHHTITALHVVRCSPSGGIFDGGGTRLADATEVPLITKGLVGRGYAEVDIRKILGLNVPRVLQATIG